MKKANKIKIIHLLWIIPIIFLISFFIGMSLDDSADEKIFNVGTIWACYDGCFNMIEVYEGNENKPYNDTIKVRYDVCLNKCNDKYFPGENKPKVISVERVIK